ncbi:acyl-CoA thioesterase/bile acid-CoA:amino acid N-acyltransferase family protein [Diaminobutyricibacter sp. McL0608]|uniref:acyl-CoA thioesterase/bile acid-CoA:amino acid N-acyltransferase family protein n=1 Tax=Leifsonia sp. McL0608 TaxID=3143537 RepID=UPI0031F2DE9C
MRRRIGRKVVAFAAAMMLGAVLSACTADAGTPGTRFVIGQLNAITTDPVTISLVGLQPGLDVTVAATVAKAGQHWRSRAIYPVPPSGAVDLGAARPSLAPYPAADASGLLWSLEGPPQTQAQLEHLWAGGDIDIELMASEGGHVVATTKIHRPGLAGFATVTPVFAGDVIRNAMGKPMGGTAYDLRIGTFYRPAALETGRKPAVVLIDGDDGGSSAPFIAGQLALAGFPTFVLPAFGPEGQIPGSSALSVESFDAGLSWLRSQPNIDPQRIFTFGSWRASPLALWLASNEPQRIYGAIGASGATALLCTSESGTAIITHDGVGVPCEDPGRTIADMSLIRLDRIPGPVLLACGETDETLGNACSWLGAGVSVRGSRPGDEFIRAPGAGHEITVPPMLPIGLAGLDPKTAQATESARVAFWSGVVLMLQAATE